MINAFGFRGGEFGNWTNQAERQGNLNLCYNALKDLADILDMDASDVSLGGDLSIAFGARGRGRALAHYEPTYKVITGGAGALAHEWGHALDAKLGQIAGYACELLSDKDEADHYKISRNPEVIPAALELFKKLKFKELKRPAEKSPERMEAVERLLNYIRAKKPENLTAYQEIYWEANVEAALHGFIEDATEFKYTPTYYFSDEITKAMEHVGAEVTYQDKTNISFHCGRVKSFDGPRTVETDFYKGSKTFDKKFSKSDKGYWASTAEMFARAFDCYVADKLEAKGIRDDYLTAYADSYYFVDDNGIFASAVPVGEEREEINRCFDRLICALHERELFHKVEMNIDGYGCNHVETWTMDCKDCAIGQCIGDPEFYYGKVGYDPFEFDHKPDRDEVESRYTDLEAERAIDLHEASVQPFYNSSLLNEAVSKGDFSQMNLMTWMQTMNNTTIER